MFLEVENQNITDLIKNGSYNFFSADLFFGFGDAIRLVKMIHIFLNFILLLLILISIIKNRKRRLSISLKLTANILIINFMHTLSYIINWVTNLDKAYVIDNNNKIGGLLVGAPLKNFGVCEFQGFMLIFTALSQDILINIFFYIINRPSIPSKQKIIVIYASLGYFLPFLIAFIYFLIGGLGLNDRYCYIKKFKFEFDSNNNPAYYLYDYFRVLIVIVYLIRGINLMISCYLLYNIIKFVKSHNIKKNYILKSSTILIVQMITVSIGIIYRISNIIPGSDNTFFSNIFLNINTLDGIFFPLSYSLSNGIYTDLFCHNFNNDSIMSIYDDSDEISNNSILDTKNEKSFAMVDVKEDNNNFDISYY